MPRLMDRLLAVGCTASLLAACGGGGSSGLRVAPIPPAPVPNPTPPPPPPPPPPVLPPLPSGPLGLTGGPFVTAAAEFDTITGTWPEETTATIRSGDSIVSIRHSASDNSYVVTLPTYGEGRLTPTSGNGSYLASGAATWQRLTSVNHRMDGASGEQPVTVTLSYPPSGNLTYTSLGIWTSVGQGVRRQGVFAYGLPTAAGTMPVSGSASYRAEVQGYSSRNNAIYGNALLQFDFGRGTLAGELNLETDNGWDPVDLGKFIFRDTVYGSGSLVFSGRLIVPRSEDTGNFAGRFTGPAGAELLGSFTTPAWNPNTQRWEDVSGVFAGKRN